MIPIATLPLVHSFGRKVAYDYVHNYLPRQTSDELTPFLDASVDVSIYHYDRRDEIYSGVEEFLIDKARMKLLFQGAYAYARRKPGRLAAKVITRGIPYIGWALLGYDIYQLYQWYQD